MSAFIATYLKRRSAPFWMLVVTLIMAFLLGGGSRADIHSLIVLRPLSVLILGYGLSGLTWRQARDHGFLFGMAAATIGLVLLQLVPLPPSLWSILPGRGLIADIGRAADLGTVWRPISLVPSASWNAFFALLLPLAVLVLAARLNLEERSNLLSVMIGLGLASGVLAVLQIEGAGDGSLYLYRVTNNGAAVGLFANRNHQAVFLATLFPMLAAFASADRPSSFDARLRSVAALGTAAFLVPLLLVTGSRAGMVAGGVALLAIPFIYRLPPARGTRLGAVPRWVWWATVSAIAVAGLVSLTIVVGRAEAIDRLIKGLSGDEVRYRAWRPVLALAWRYFPIGSGFGTFREVFQIGEPRELLATTLFYHAHNDWLELLLTGGLPAVLLLAVAGSALVVKIFRMLRSPRDRDGGYVLASAGGWILMLFALASISDYPLRVPAIACVFVVAVMWISSFRSYPRTPKIN